MTSFQSGTRKVGNGFSWRSWRALTTANLKSYLRNPVAAFGLFILLTLLLIGIRALEISQSQPSRVALANQSSYPASKTMVAVLKSEPGLAVSQTTAREALSELAAGRVDLAVIIPQGLGSADADGHLLPAQVAIHYKSGTAAAQGSVDLVAAAIDSADRRTQGAPALFTPSVVTTIPTVTTVGLILPGLLSFNLINSGLMLAAGIFAGYRSAGILRRIEATGTAPSTLVLAHAAANIVLAVSQVLVFSLIADLVFDLRLNLPAMLLSAGLGYMVFLGLGLAISGWVRDAQQAPVIATAIGMPMIFIGLFPPGTVPGLAGQLVSYLPVSLTTDALRHIIDGGDILGVRSDLIALAGWALMVLLVASRSFRWDES